MFCSPIPMSLWRNIDWLCSKRVSEDGLELSIDNFYGWGYSVDLMCDGWPVKILIPEADLNTMVGRLFPGITPLSASWRDLLPALQIAVSPICHLFGSKVEIADLYLKEIDRPGWFIKCLFPPGVDSPFEGVQLLIEDISIDFLKSATSSWSEEDITDSIRELYIPFELEIGSVSLSANDFITIVPGCVLLTSETPATEMAQSVAWLSYGMRFGRVACNSVSEFDSLKCISIEVEGEVSPVNIVDFGGKPLQLPIRVLASVGHLRMPMESFKNLEEGSLIEEKVELYDAVHLIVNGVTIAKGELFWAGTQWSMRVTEVLVNLVELERTLKKKLDDEGGKLEETL